jgi:hypothetical protein
MQTIELQQRSKVIEELKNSLSVLINKYNELKKDYDKKFSKRVFFKISHFGFSFEKRRGSILEDKPKIDLNLKLIKENENLKSESISKDNTINLLKEEILGLKEQYEENLQNFNKKCEFFEIEKMSLKNTINELQNETALRIKFFNENINLKETYMESIQVEKENLKLENENFKTIISDETKQCEEYLKQIKDLNNTVELLKVENKNKASQFKNLFSNHFETFNKAVKSLSLKFNEKIKKQKEKIKNLAEMILQIQKTNFSVKEKNSESLKTITILYEKVKQAIHEKNKFNQNLIQKIEEQKVYLNTISVYEQEIVILKQKIEKSQSSKQILQIELEEVNIIKNDISIYKKQIQDLTNKLDQYKIENQGKSKVIEELNEEIKLLKTNK